MINVRKASEHKSLASQLSFRLVLILAINTVALFMFVLLTISAYNLYMLRESREDTAKNVIASLQPIINRLDLRDVNVLLESIASASDMDALELTDFYGYTHSTNDEITRTNPYDIELEILNEYGQNSTLRIWWSNYSKLSSLFRLLLFGIITLFLVTSVIAWFGVRHSIKKLIDQPLSRLLNLIGRKESHSATYLHEDIGSLELNNVLQKFAGTLNEKETAFKLAKMETQSRNRLIDEMSNVMSLANRSIKFFRGREADSYIHIGRNIPHEIDQLLNLPKRSFDEVRKKAINNGWITTIILDERETDATFGKYWMEVELDYNHIWSIIAVSTSPEWDRIFMLGYKYRKNSK